MARQNLSDLSPEQVKARKNEQARRRMAQMRKKKRAKRDMARQVALLNTASPEVVEFVTDIRDLPLHDKVELVAAWERRYGQRLPVDSFVVALSGETSEDYWLRKNQHRDIGLAKILAHDFFGRKKARDRKIRFNNAQSSEAQRLGITVFELQRRRKIAAQAKARAKREIGRLANKSAA